MARPAGAIGDAMRAFCEVHQLQTARSTIASLEARLTAALGTVAGLEAERQESRLAMLDVTNRAQAVQGAFEAHAEGLVSAGFLINGLQPVACCACDAVVAMCQSVMFSADENNDEHFVTVCAACAGPQQLSSPVVE